MLIVSCFHRVGASSFLSRVQGHEFETMNAEPQSTIMRNIEEMLGTDNVDIDGRLDHVEGLPRTTFNALPKNGQGKLDHAAVRYTLHGYFVQRHGWYVRGLSDVGEGFSGTSESDVLQDKV